MNARSPEVQNTPNLVIDTVRQRQRQKSQSAARTFTALSQNNKVSGLGENGELVNNTNSLEKTDS